MTELALDDVDRDPFAGELDRMRVTQLVGGESSSHTGVGGELAQFSSSRGSRPPPAARGPSMTQNSGPGGRETR